MTHQPTILLLLLSLVTKKERHQFVYPQEFTCVSVAFALPYILHVIWSQAENGNPVHVPGFFCLGCGPVTLDNSPTTGGKLTTLQLTFLHGGGGGVRKEAPVVATLCSGARKAGSSFFTCPLKIQHFEANAGLFVHTKPETQRGDVIGAQRRSSLKWPRRDWYQLNSREFDVFKQDTTLVKLQFSLEIQTGFFLAV